MSEVVQHAETRVWEGPLSEVPPSSPVHPVGACSQCASEFVPGASFCHVCGVSRPAPARPHGWTSYFEFQQMQQWVGLSTAAFIAFMAGIGCLLCALGVGLVLSAQTLAEWQAVQLWRIQWLLAATAAFVAGLLLKQRTR